MAVNASHAADSTGKSFSVEVMRDGEAPEVIGSGLADFMDAVDCAVEWLEREDPARAGGLSVQVFATAGDTREQVFAYPPEAGRPPVQSTRLVELFGFDPVTWHNPAPRRYQPAPEPTLGRLRLAPFEPAEPEEELEPVPLALVEALDAVELPAPRAHASLRTRAARTLKLEWGDPVARACLLVAALSLWLMLTLLEPSFAAPLLAAVAGLWYRRAHRAPVALDGVDDWF